MRQEMCCANRITLNRHAGTPEWDAPASNKLAAAQHGGLNAALIELPVQPGEGN